MAIIVDPDDLNQGTETAVADTVFTVPGTGADVQITSVGSNMPALAAGEFFEIRDMADAENNGLFQVVTVNTSTSDYECDKVTATAPVSAASEASRFFGATGVSTEKSIHYDTNARDIYLLEQGNLSVDGVTLQAVYSKIKLDWKADNDLIPHPFPAIAITPEQFEFIDDWNPQDNTGFSIRTRKLIRTGGWSEVAELNAQLLQQYAGVITLGSFEDNVNDTAYFQFGDDPTDTGAAVDFDFAGPVNEAVRSYLADATGPEATPNGFDFANANPDTIARNDGGSWITDGFQVGSQVTVRNATNATNNGTYFISAMTASTLTVLDQDGVSDAGLVADTDDNTAVFDINNRNKFRPRIRVRDADPNGKTFDASDLPSIGITDPDGFNNRVFRFPLSNATDLKIAETDANIAANTPYTEIRLRYLDAAYNREVDSATKRNFGIIIDVGTYSAANGVSNGTTLFTSANFSLGAGEALADYTGGDLIIHEGTDQGTHTISGTPVDNAGTLEITLTAALTGSQTDLSFTVQRSSPVVATAEEIYEKVQFQLRQASDIDDYNSVVTGRTADELLTFVGDSLQVGNADTSLPTNPAGGGTGVFIENFSANDTNRLSFFDNTGTARTFPFVAAGTISFNANLVNDTGPAEFFMFFEYTERFTNTGFGLSGASGDTATLDSSVTDLVAELADGDYIRLSGLTNAVNNGIFVLTGAPAGVGPWTVTVRKINGDTLVNETAGASVSLDKNPIDSPDAILVDDNGGADITGTIGASSVAFDFDYDNNVQGGRTAGTDADIVIRALGEDLAAFVETFGTITRATGLSFSVVAPLERNFTNPV